MNDPTPTGESTRRSVVAPAQLRTALPEPAATELDAMVRELATTPEHIDRLFPAAARRTTRGDIGLVAGDGHPIPAEDAVRVELLCTALPALVPEQRQTELAQLYRFGDSAEKRAVLRGLSAIADLVDATPLTEDALRTNDVRLVAAAMGPYASRLTTDVWRQGVLKCLFVGVPLSAVHGLAARADAELADMIARYAHERVAAGRDVSQEIWQVLDRFPDSIALIELDAESASAHQDRREAAQRLAQSRPQYDREQ